jgi:hypothetical protein
MKIKNIVLLISILLAVCLVAGCAAEKPTIDPTIAATTAPTEEPTQAPTEPTVATPTTPPSTEATQPTTNPTEPDSDDDMEIMPEVVKYDEKYQELKTLGSTVGATVIPFPSTVEATETFMEEFYTAEEFRNYLDTYSDLLGSKNAKIEIADDGFVYQHGFSTYATKGYVPRFFFLSSKSFQPLYLVDVEEVKYDQETKSVYIILEVEDVKHSMYAVGDTMKENIDNNAKATYGILYFDIDEDFKDKVEHVYFVLPQ